MVDLTFKQLRYFEAMARHCHFGRAADACAITQPSMSMQIKDLEHSLGAALFERGARTTICKTCRAPRETGCWDGCVSA
jgi:LysR family hydrogen peroxide-inducible transcriptional activator